MAYIIRPNYEDKYISTDVEFTDSDDAVRALFKQTPPNPLMTAGRAN